MRTWTEFFHSFLVAALLGLLAPETATAEDAFTGRIRTARHLIERQRYTQALEELARARPLAGGEPLRGVVLALHAGFAFAQSGDSEQALAAFRAALAADPRARLPLPTSPRLAREFEELRLRVSKELLQPPTDAPRVLEREALLLAWVKEFPRPQPTLPPLDLSTRVLRPRVAAPAAAATVMVLSGSVFWLMARSEQSRFRTGTPPFENPDDVQRSVSRGKTFQALGFGLWGTGALALVIAVSQYVRREPDLRSRS